MVLLKIIILVSKNYSFYTKIFSDCKKIRENVRGIGTTRQSRGIFDDERVAQWYIRDGSELNSKIILGVTDRSVPCSDWTAVRESIFGKRSLLESEKTQSQR